MPHAAAIGRAQWLLARGLRRGYFGVVFFVPRRFVFAALRLLLLPCLSLAVVCHGAGLEDDAAYAEARQALEAGLPGVAALKAEALLARKGAKWSADDKEKLATLAAEGWTRDRQPERVLALLKGKTRPHGALFWRGQALLMQDKLEEAEAVLRDHEKAGRYAERARLCLALVFLAQGREALARREIKELRESEDAELARRARLMFNESELTVSRERVVLDRLRREPGPDDGRVAFLQAEALFQEGRLDEAAKLAAALLKNKPGGPDGLRLNQAATLLHAGILLEQDRAAAAQEALVRFLSAHAGGDFFHEAFVLLERVREALPGGQGERLPEAVFEWMTQESRPERRGYALYLAACWLAGQGRGLEAAALLESLLAAHPGHRRESDAMRKAMEIEGALGHDKRVLDLAEIWRNRYGGGGASLVDLIAGGVLHARGEHAEALARFQRAADLAAALPERRRSLFNAAVAALKAGETALYASLLGQLQSVSATDAQGQAGFTAGEKSGETAADLELDRALALAAKGDAAASQELSRFVETYSDHRRWAEAQVALAELALLDSPPRVRAAETALEEAEKHPEAAAEEAIRQRIAYTRLWCREAEADWKGVTEAGARFLQQWPASEQAAGVQMKVADAYYRLEDYANARTQFELVAKNFPRSDYAEAALYFAGKSAVNLRNVDAAIDLWEEVAAQGGRLSRQARIQQAAAKRREGKEPEALKVVDSLLAEKNLDIETRRLLLCDKAEMLILMGTAEPRHLSSAVSVLRGLLGTPDLPAAWRARAGYWLAHALDARRDDAAALEACHDVVVRSGQEPGGLDPEVSVWYYRAGFLAVELLQKQGQWEGAARMAERLAAAGGERATEAKNIATKIRLERFLWDERQ